MLTISTPFNIFFYLYSVFIEIDLCPHKQNPYIQKLEKMLKIYVQCCQTQF